MIKKSRGLLFKFEKHLARTVGKRPKKSEIDRIDKELKNSFGKIYDKPNKSPKFIKNIYDLRLSKLWGRVVAHEATFSEVKLFLKHSKANPNSHMVSLASGLGVFELFIAKEFITKGKICCIDISKGMSHRAKSFMSKLKLKNTQILVGNITKLPIKANSQNIVLARRTGLSNDKKWNTILKESYRVLKREENSRFIYTVDNDFNKPLNKIKSDLHKARLYFITMEHFTKKDNKQVDLIVAKPEFTSAQSPQYCTF